MELKFANEMEMCVCVCVCAKRVQNLKMKLNKFPWQIDAWHEACENMSLRNILIAFSKKKRINEIQPKNVFRVGMRGGGQSNAKNARIPPKYTYKMDVSDEYNEMEHYSH